MLNEELEAVINKRIKPLLDNTMHQLLGIKVEELSTDISDKIKKSPLLDFPINTHTPFKQAKLAFKKSFLNKLLQNHSGNVSDVAKIADIERRSIHRLISKLKIDVKKFREELEQREYKRQTAMQDLIEKALETYKPIFNEKKIEEVYHVVPQLSKNILKELPEKETSLNDAEQLFETEYLTKALQEHNWNISKTAHAIGLRFETLHRKMKALNIQKP